MNVKWRPDKFGEQQHRKFFFLQQTVVIFFLCSYFKGKKFVSTTMINIQRINCRNFFRCCCCFFYFIVIFLLISKTSRKVNRNLNFFVVVIVVVVDVHSFDWYRPCLPVRKSWLGVREREREERKQFEILSPNECVEYVLFFFIFSFFFLLFPLYVIYPRTGWSAIIITHIIFLMIAQQTHPF